MVFPWFSSNFPIFLWVCLVNVETTTSWSTKSTSGAQTMATWKVRESRGRCSNYKSPWEKLWFILYITLQLWVVICSPSNHRVVLFLQYAVSPLGVQVSNISTHFSAKQDLVFLVCEWTGIVCTYIYSLAI